MPIFGKYPVNNSTPRPGGFKYSPNNESSSSSTSSSKSKPTSESASSNSGGGGGFRFKSYNGNEHSNSSNYETNSRPTFGGFSTTASRLQLKNKVSKEDVASKDGSKKLVPSFFKSGKVAKRVKSEPKKYIDRSQVQKCFNLAEKEKFRELLEQGTLNIGSKNTGNIGSRNIYQSLIHSSPTRIRDDNTFDSKRQQQQMNKGEVLMEKLNLPMSNMSIPVINLCSPSRVSVGYTRRISLSLDSKPDKYTSTILKNTSNNLVKSSLSTSNNNVADKDRSIIEIDLTVLNQTSNKSAQKRHNQYDENDDRAVNGIEKFRKESKDYYSTYHNPTGNKSNRTLNELEKNWNESLTKNQIVLEAILKKSHIKSSALLLEEERYKLKKRQRLEKDKTERELAQKFSLQLQLDTNKLSGIYLQEDEEDVIEDEFPELQSDHERLINDALINYPQEEVLVNAFGISITRKDIQTLRGLNWLNDEIVNFYMNLICERGQQQKQGYDYKIYAFTTFFYPKLVKDGFVALKRWTRKVELFTYDFILVPVHLGLHWTLAVIDFNCREIRYYDSMNGNNNECLKALRNYLKDEYADKKPSVQFDLSTWNCIHVKDVPQQMNGSDCGMFTCKYAEFVSRGKTVFNFNQSHMPYFRRRMIWEIINKKLM